MSASVAVLHTGALAAGAPDPVDRQLLRRVLVLARVVPVTLVCAEPQLGPVRAPELDAAGVTVVEAPATVDRWLVEHPSVTAVVATSVPLAERVRHARPDVPVVIDLVALPALAHEHLRLDQDALEHDGVECMADHLRARDGGVLHHAAAVLVPTDDLARAVRAIAPGATVHVVAAAVPCAAERTPPRTRRVAVVGGVAS